MKNQCETGRGCREPLSADMSFVFSESKPVSCSIARPPPVVWSGVVGELKANLVTWSLRDLVIPLHRKLQFSLQNERRVG